MVIYFINSKLKKNMCFFLILIYIFIYYRKEFFLGRVVVFLVEEFEIFMKQRFGFVEDFGLEVRKKIVREFIFVVFSSKQGDVFY